MTIRPEALLVALLASAVLAAGCLSLYWGIRRLVTRHTYGALRSTTKGLTELWPQEQKAEENFHESRRLIQQSLMALTTLHLAHEDRQRRLATVARQGDRRAIVLHREAFPRYADLLVPELQKLEQSVAVCEAAVEDLIECWSGYAAHARVVRDGLRPNYERLRPALQIYAGVKTIPLTDAMRDEFRRSSYGYSPQLDQSLDTYLALVERVIKANHEVSEAATAFLVCLDTWRRRERIRLAITRRLVEQTPLADAIARVVDQNREVGG